MTPIPSFPTPQPTILLQAFPSISQDFSKTFPHALRGMISSQSHYSPSTLTPADEILTFKVVLFVIASDALALPLSIVCQYPGQPGVGIFCGEKQDALIRHLIALGWMSLAMIKPSHSPVLFSGLKWIFKRNKSMLCGGKAYSL